MNASDGALMQFFPSRTAILLTDPLLIGTNKILYATAL